MQGIFTISLDFELHWGVFDKRDRQVREACYKNTLRIVPQMLELFGKWSIGKQGVMALGFFTLLSVVLMLIPKTFVWGNFLMAAGILLIICFHLLGRDLKGVMIEVPFFLLSLVIIYLQHPMVKVN